jgi:hypothetical protein
MGTKSKSLVLVIVALFLTSLVIISSASSTQGAPTWNTQRIIDKASSGFGIAIDSNDYPHIAYTAILDRGEAEVSPPVIRILYSSWNGSGWVNQTIPKQIIFSDLTLDAQNNAHIVGRDYNVETLLYIHWTGQDWSIQKVAGYAYEASIALDSDGNPHIAYLAYDSSLKYASWNGSTWDIKVVDTEDLQFRVSLKIDSSNNPHILYQKEDVNKSTRTNIVELTKYATYDNASGWTVQPAGSATDFGNMVLDSKGHPHFVDHGRYFSWTGSTWVVQSLSSKFNSTTVFYDRGYVALDKKDNPSIDLVISTKEASALSYLRWTGNDWLVQTVKANPVTAGPLAVDSKGTPHLCYLSSGNMGIFGISYATADESNTSSNNNAMTAIVAVAVLIVVISFVLLRRHRRPFSQNKPNS